MFRSRLTVMTFLVVATLTLTGCPAGQRRPDQTPAAPGPVGMVTPRTAATTAAADPSITLTDALSRAGGGEALVLGNTALITGRASVAGPGETATPGMAAGGPGPSPVRPGAAAVPGATGAPPATRAGTPTSPPAGPAGTPGPTDTAGPTDTTRPAATDTGATVQVVTATLPWITEVRVAPDGATTERLRTIATQVRAGKPVTEFLGDLADLTRSMTSIPVAPDAKGAPTPGTTGTPAPGATPGTTGTVAPGTSAPGTTGTAPAPTGTTTPGTTR